jgi:poly(3-hydroxybutyrate) depolymerase
MNDQMQNGMAEATRLTQQGRLDEATAAIQRALGGTFAPVQEGPGVTNVPIEYAAVGVHSGLAPGSAHDMSSAFNAMRQGGPVGAYNDVPGGHRKALPTIVFHGDGDTTVHPRNGDRFLDHLAGGGNGSSSRVRTRQGQVPGGYEYTRFTYRDAEGRDLVERWSVHGLGHAWSGGSYPGSYTDPRGPDASAEMVRFFRQHHKR